MRNRPEVCDGVNVVIQQEPQRDGVDVVDGFTGSLLQHRGQSVKAIRRHAGKVHGHHINVGRRRR